MPWVGSILPRSMLPIGNDEKRAQRKRDDRKEASEAGSFERALDKAELSVEGVEKVSEVHDTKKAATEEGREDHEVNTPTPAPIQPPPHIDLKG
jgi:hypothetical protein